MATKIKKNQINIDTIYPVGSIYLTTVSTNPSTYFGGTWVAWGTGRVPVGIDTEQTEFNTVEKTGGAKTHTLTINEMPNHSHFISNIRGQQSGGGVWGNFPEIETAPTGGWDKSTGGSGGGQAHNNLQPYIVTYMFKRTA